MIWENSDSIKAQFNLLASVRFKDTLERILAFSHYPDRNVRLHGQSGLIFDRGPELRYHINNSSFSFNNSGIDLVCGVLLGNWLDECKGRMRTRANPAC